MSGTNRTAGEITVAEALTDGDVLATRDVMRKLRPNILAESYLPSWRCRPGEGIAARLTFLPM